MQTLLAESMKRVEETTSLIRKLVECESPSDDAAAVDRFTDLFAAEVGDIAKMQAKPGGRFGRHLQCEFQLPGKRKSGKPILALGHADTVWPLGTLREMPFKRDNGRLWGPGVLDMKAGLALFVTAMRILRDRDIPVAAKVRLQINSDEEVGSDSSRPLTEKEALRSRAVLVLEPAAGLDGRLKTGRKGVGAYILRVHGKSAHAGLDPTAGANAIVELARQTVPIAGFTDMKRGLTVNPGVVRGGSRSNVVPALAELEVDIRVARLRDFAPLDRKFQKLRAIDKRCHLELTGGLNRPPMERTKAVKELYRQARSLGRQIGLKLDEAVVGGGSDGNFTAALGVPTLDGLGAVGEGAHAAHESILEDCIAPRTALLAGMVVALAGGR